MAIGLKRPLRNTTGHTVTHHFLGRFTEKSERAPRGQPWQFEAPDHHPMVATVDKDDPQFLVTRAQNFLTSCTQAVNRQQALPAAKLPGRIKSYLTACKRKMGSTLGLGLGEQPQFKPSWARPDRALPKINLKTENPNRTLSSELRRAIQHRKKLERDLRYLQSVKVHLLSDMQAAQTNPQAEHALEQELEKTPLMLADLEVKLEEAEKQELTLIEKTNQSKKNVTIQLYKPFSQL
jgi:hypothetical protein